MTFWFLLAALAGASPIIIMVIIEALRGPTAEEQQVDALLAALWKERAQQDRRREQLNAVVRVTEGRR